MKIQLSDRDNVQRVVVTKKRRELETVLTLDPREAMIVKNLLGNVWGDPGVSHARAFTDSLYWRLAEFGVPGLAKSVFSFAHDSMKARPDLDCHLYSEGECAIRFAANRDFINKERDAGRLFKSYQLPYSGTCDE